MTGWALDKILFFLLCHSFYIHCSPDPVTSSSALGIQIPPSSVNRVARYPGQAAKQGRTPLGTTALSQAHRRLAGGGTWQLLLAASKRPRKKSKARKRRPQGGFSAFTKQGTPGRDRIIIQVMFSSLHYWPGAAALGWAVSTEAGSPSLHQDIGRTLPPCKANPWQWRGSAWISVLISNCKAQEQLSTCNFWFCFLFLLSCRQSLASEKCYKQPWPSWKKQYAVSLTSTSLFRSLSALWLMVLFINVGRLSAFPE